MQIPLGTFLGTSVGTGGAAGLGAGEAVEIIGNSLFPGADMLALGAAAVEGGQISASALGDAKALAGAVHGASAEEWQAMQASALRHHPLLRPGRALAGEKGDGKSKTGKNSRRTTDLLPDRFKPFARIFRGSLHSLEEIAQAFQLMEELGGRWKQMADDFERLRQERLASGESGNLLGTAFEITVEGDGTYCQRDGLQKRRTDLASGIVLDRRLGTLLGFIHELTHALPLEVLAPELAALPYEDEETKPATFGENVAENYHLLVQSAYQDESISVLAEILFYRDLKKAGIPVETLFAEEERDFLEEGLTLYETEGVQAYLQSEIYIGRNHRLDYNKNGLVQMAFMVSLQPELADVEGFQAVLAEKGIGFEAKGEKGGELAPLFKAVSEFLQTPTIETAQGLGEAFLSTGFHFSLDLPKLIAQGKEALALVTGKQQKASASFAGKRKETETLAGLLSVNRRQFDKTRGDFEAAWQRASGVAAEVDWKDGAGLLQFYHLLVTLRQGGEEEAREDLSALGEKVRAVLVENARRWTYDQLGRIFTGKMSKNYDTWRKEKDFLSGQFGDLENYTEGVLLLAEAAIERDEEKRSAALSEIFENLYFTTRLGPGGRDPLFALLTQTLEDPFIRAGLKRLNVSIGLRSGTDRYISETTPLQIIATSAEEESFSLTICGLLRENLVDRNFLFRFFTLLITASDINTTRLLTGLILGDPEEVDEEEWTWESLLHYWQIALLQLRTRLFGPPFRKLTHLDHRVFQLNDGVGVRGKEQPLLALSESENNGLSTALQIQQSLVGKNGRNSTPPTLPFPPRGEGWGGGRVRGGEGEDEKEPRSDFYWASLPLLIPLSPHGEEHPPGLRTFPPTTSPHVDSSLIAFDARETARLLTLLRRFQGIGTPPDEIDIHTITSFPLEIWPVITGPSNLPDSRLLAIGSDAENLWAQVSLLLELIPLMGRGGHLAKAKELLQNIYTALEPAAAARSETLRTTVRFALAAAETVETFLPLFAESRPERQRTVLEEIRKEYETTLRLRRRFHSPHLIIRELRSLVDQRDLREAVGTWIPVVIDQLALFDIHTDDFRRGFVSILRFVEEAPFLYQDKDRWLTLLFEKVLPKRQTGLSLEARGITKQLRFLEWMEQTLLTGEQLAKISYYAGAKQRVLERVAGLLEDLQAIRLPGEMQSRLLAVATRTEQLLRRLHPELTDTAALGKLEVVSKDPAYQQALTDIFPSRRVLIDESLSVAQWSPTAVRRGLPDPQKSWKRLQRSLNQAPELGPRAAVYEAFVLDQIERSGKPAFSIEEAYDLFRRYREQKAAGDQHAPLRGTLSFYVAARRLFSSKDRLLLEQLTKIPAVGWGLQRVEEGVARGGLNEKEEAILDALLSAPTVSDAYRKRELFLMVLENESLPLSTRRKAARGLATGTAIQGVLENLVEGYSGPGGAVKEAVLYRLMTEYWSRIGALPDADNLMLMDEEGQKENSIFWNIFDDVLSQSNTGRFESDTEILVRVLSRGKHGARYLAELRDYLTARNPERLNLVFGEEFETLIGRDPATRERVLPLLEGVDARLTDHRERLDILRLNPPPAFLRQPREIRFLLLSFLKHFSSGQIESLIAELRELGEEGKPDAEIFLRFFERTGLEKAGQFLSTMVGVVPDAARTIFESLQDRVNESSFREVQRTVEKEMGGRLEDFFLSFDKAPVASASMGEVYRAVLKDGREVYLKVAPPSKRAKTTETIATLEKVIREVEKEKGRLKSGFDLGGILRRFLRQLKQQIDFSKEAQNAGQVKGINTPVYLRQYTTPSLLVMLPVEGIKPLEVASAQERTKVAEVYAVSALRMLLVGGVYHADPHPGNQIWNTAEGKLTWLDWGVIGYLGETGRNALIPFLGAAIAGQAAEQIERLRPIAGSPYGEESFEHLRERLTETPLEGPPGERVRTLLAMAGAEQIYLEPDMMQAIAFLLTVTGVATDLGPSFDIGQAALTLYRQGLEEAAPPPLPPPLSEEEKAAWGDLLKEVEILLSTIQYELRRVDPETRESLTDPLTMIRGAKGRGETFEETVQNLDRLLEKLLEIHSSFEAEKSRLFDRLMRILEKEETLAGDPDTVAEILEEINKTLPPHRRWQGDPILKMEEKTALSAIIRFFRERKTILLLHLTAKSLREDRELFK